MAGEPPPPRTISGTVDLAGLFPDYRHFNFLLGTASSLVERQPEAAIATAQMAMESFVHITFEVLLRLHGIKPPLSERLADLVEGSLMSKPTRALWHELTDSKLNKTSVGEAWPAYQEHVERRNAMVHAGGRARPEDGKASVDAVKDMLAHMIEVARQREKALRAAGRVPPDLVPPPQGPVLGWTAQVETSDASGPDG